MTTNTLTTKLVYLVDALGSAALGLVLIAFAGPLAGLFGSALPATALLVVGIGLLPWAAFNLWIARRDGLPRSAATLNVVGDIGWIVASVALVALAGSALTLIGVLAVTAIGLFVALVCALKATGLRQAPALA